MLFISIKRSRPKRRELYAQEGIPDNIRRRINGFRLAQLVRIGREFNKTPDGTRIVSEMKEGSAKLEKIVGAKGFIIEHPLDEKTRKLLSNPVVRKIASRQSELKVKYFERLIEFTKTRKDIYKGHIGKLEQKLEEAKEEAMLLERDFKSL